MEKIGKLNINRSHVLGKGRFGRVFFGNYLGKDVAIKRAEKESTQVDTTIFLNAQGHPNIIHHYYIKENKDPEHM